MDVKISRFILAATAAFIHPGMGSPACPVPSSSRPIITTDTLPASCTYRPTATTYQTSGCDFSCPTSSVWCIVDAYVVLPCGCDRAAVSPTTVTRCPTTSANCLQCSTGWGIATITDSDCPPSATATAA
ncbi:hypothetical protein VTI28DRAFT_8696 [Corynascus sepedonium]